MTICRRASLAAEQIVRRCEMAISLTGKSRETRRRRDRDVSASIDRCNLPRVCFVLAAAHVRPRAPQLFSDAVSYRSAYGYLDT